MPAEMTKDARVDGRKRYGIEFRKDGGLCLIEVEILPGKGPQWKRMRRVDAHHDVIPDLSPEGLHNSAEEAVENWRASCEEEIRGYEEEILRRRREMLQLDQILADSNRV